MPVMQPAELWQESGRWDDYGPELMRLKDRHGREFCLGPTHEEIVTTLVRDELRSYRDLPVSLYQIQVKFRDEVRPRFGLLARTRVHHEGRVQLPRDAGVAPGALRRHGGAYARICERLGLEYRAVEADSGQIGGKVTTEFMALAESGEAELVYCELRLRRQRRGGRDGRAAHSRGHRARAAWSACTRPSIRTIAELAAFLGIEEHDTVKTMAGGHAGRAARLLLRSGRPRAQPRQGRAGSSRVSKLLDEEDFAALGICRRARSVPSASPEGTLVVADRSLESDVRWGVGANENDYHLIDAHARPRLRGRAVGRPRRRASPATRCPVCGGTLLGARGIEVSQVFQLGTKYSDSMDATFTDEDGVEQPFIMGCYGVGVSRSLAAVDRAARRRARASRGR